MDGCSGASDAPARNTVIDPGTVTVRTADAERFAALFKRTDGHPTAAQLQSGYMDAGRRSALNKGVAVNLS